MDTKDKKILIPASSPEILWFKAKCYGWGWTPITWQGWLVIVLYIYLIYHDLSQTDLFFYSTFDNLVNDILPFIAYTTFLFLICYAKGEKPGWRWGK